MKLNITVESKNFDHDKDLSRSLEKNPCKLCILGQGMMCVERKFCRWHSHKEIYVKVEAKEIK